MDIKFDRLRQFIEHPLVIFLTWILSNIGVFLAVLTIFGVTFSYTWLLPTIYVAVTALIGLGTYCTYSLYHENKRLKKCIHELHQVNHLYRDTISKRFFDSGNTEVLNDNELIEREKMVLHNVCAKIASIFRYLTNQKCFVGVYLIRTIDGENLCSLHTASEYESSRFPAPPETFKVNADNTRFWDAGVKKSSCIYFFHSANLKKTEDYNDQTQHYESQYKSCIVVPIRYCANRKGAKPDDIGFLVVDTLATERLNNGFHVHYLAAFADQMYNFQNIWRMKESKTGTV
jgi:hypothetical protein